MSFNIYQLITNEGITLKVPNDYTITTDHTTFNDIIRIKKNQNLLIIYKKTYNELLTEDDIKKDIDVDKVLNKKFKNKDAYSITYKNKNNILLLVQFKFKENYINYSFHFNKYNQMNLKDIMDSIVFSDQ